MFVKITKRRQKYIILLMFDGVLFFHKYFAILYAIFMIFLLFEIRNLYTIYYIYTVYKAWGVRVKKDMLILYKRAFCN